MVVRLLVISRKKRQPLIKSKLASTPCKCPGKLGLLGDTSEEVCLSCEYGLIVRQNNCWQCANQKGKLWIVAQPLSSLKYNAINLGEKMWRGIRIMVSGKNPPMPRSGWKTWCIDQIIGAKIESHRYYKTICPTQSVKINIIINNDTNLL